MEAPFLKQVRLFTGCNSIPYIFRRLNRSVRNISDIAATISAVKNPVFDVWRLGLMAVELGTAAVTTIVLRNWNWAGKWPYPDRHLKTEGNRMIVEKIAAAMEVTAEWQRAAFGAWSGAFNPWRSGRKVLAPLHRKATANARRLTRRRQR
jgi:hypothetical protein